jgi:hypothetical protein
MPLVLADRVRDTTTTTGTGTVTLSGTAPTGYQNFSVIGNGNTTYYTINAGSQWEVGIGTYSSTGPTLARTTVLESSNANALVDFAAGTKDVFVTYPADKSVNYDESNNVGIGTTSPSDKLEVRGAAAGGAITTRITNTDATGFGSLSFFDNTGARAQIWAGGASYASFGGAGSLNYSANSGPHVWYTNYTERMRITAAGDVGVGTASPLGKLQVEASNSRVIVGLSGSDNYYDADFHIFRGALSAAAPERMRINSSGNVGIGTSAPQARLDVNSGASAATAVLNSTSDTYLQLQNSGTNGLYLQSAASAAYLINQLNTPLLFGTNNTERMRLSGSGNLGVGTTATNVKFTVGGAAGDPTLNAASGIAEFRLDVTTMLAIGGYSSGSFALWLQGKQDNAGYTSTPWPISLNPAGGNVGVGTASPPSQLSVSFNPPVSIPALGSGVGGVSIGPATAYGMLVGTISDGNGYIQQQRFDGSTAVYNLLLQPSGGNVGIGTNNPLGRLAVASATGNVGFNTGTSSSPERGNLWYDTDGTGWKFNIGKRQSGTFTSQVTIQDNGNVGIGTTSPDSALTIARGAGAGAEISIRANGNAQAAEFVLSQDSGSATYLYNRANQFMSFGTNNTERMRITSAGDVGIGTTTPDIFGRFYTRSVGINSSGTTMLQINGTTYGGVDLGFNGTRTANILAETAGFYLQTVTASPMVFVTNTAERMRITSAGNVGIGTASPTRLLSVAGTANGYMDFSASSFRRYTIGSESLGFVLFDDTAATYRMVVNASGNVGIGTSAPNANLQISSANTTVLRLTTTGAATQSSLAFATVGGTGTVDMDQAGNLVARTLQGSLFFDNFGAGGSINFRTGGANTRFSISNTGSITSSDLADAVGYKGLPANVQGSGYTLVLADQGKMVTITGGVTIPANGSVAFPIGTTVVIYNNSGSNQTISITTDTLRLAGTATTGARTLAQRGFATCIKVAATEWVATGNVT